MRSGSPTTIYRVDRVINGIRQPRFYNKAKEAAKAANGSGKFSTVSLQANRRSLCALLNEVVIALVGHATPVLMAPLPKRADLPEFDAAERCPNHPAIPTISGYGFAGGGGLGPWTACRNCGAVVSKSHDDDDALPETARSTYAR